jgi:uncharacterized delta-60 repeat protein
MSIRDRFPANQNAVRRSRGTRMAALCAAGLLSAGLALAASGDLDPNFNGTGKRVIQFPPPPHVDPPFQTQANGVALQRNGKIVLPIRYVRPSGPSFALLRLNPDGSTDGSFGGGVVLLDLEYGGEAAAVAVQKDGKIVAAGTSLAGADYEFALARFRPDGTLDATFDGDGKVTTDFSDEDVCRGVAIQRDGKIVAAGTTGEGPSGDFALARYGKNGRLDPSFGGDGRVTTDFGGEEGCYAMAIDRDGKVVASGYVLDAVRQAFALARYRSDGGLDPSFDEDGKVITNFGDVEDVCYALAVQKDGKIVAAGDRDLGTGAFVVARYQKSGQLDPSFSTDGWLITDFGDGDQALGVAVQRDGKIVAAGSTGSQDESHVAVARYLGR